VDNVKLDDDRTLLQKIFRSLPRRTRLEQLSSLLLCAKGTDYRTAVCAAEWIYREVMKYRKSIRKRLAEGLLYNNVISYLRFISDPAARVFPETYEQHLLAERYRKVAEDSADVLLESYRLRHIEAVCHIIECLPSKRQKALKYVVKVFGEQGMRYILHRFRPYNVILEYEGENSKAKHRFPRRVPFDPNLEVGRMVAELLLGTGNSKQTKTSAHIDRYFDKETQAKIIAEAKEKEGNKTKVGRISGVLRKMRALLPNRRIAAR